MKISSRALAVIASLGLFAAFAHAQQSDPVMQQGSRSDSQEQMKQQGAVMQDGQTIKQVQQALSNQGYDPGPADGKWSSKTESALKEFQQAQGVTATGQIDQQTLALLGIAGSAAGGPQDMSSRQSGTGGQPGGSKH